MREIKVEPRSFNFMELDKKRGLLTKRSTHKDKLRAEIRWYLKLPKKLRYLAPRIFDYSLSQDSPFISMEFYGYRTLHEMLISFEGGISDSDCEEIFQRLLFVVEEFQAHRLQCDRATACKAVKAMCVEKPARRLGVLAADDDFKDFFARTIRVNGKSYPSLNEIIALLPAMTEHLLFENVEKYFSVIHGDLCLPNILIEAENKFLRLVDPRGEFGDFDIYGDWRYDLAKLLHSLEGGYDLIIADEFKINVSDTSIDYEMTCNFTRVREIFFAVFAAQLRDLPALRLIEATLFLSMIPLHADSLSRQQAMLARGVELFGAVWEDTK